MAAGGDRTYGSARTYLVRFSCREAVSVWVCASTVGETSQSPERGFRLSRNGSQWEQLLGRMHRSQSPERGFRLSRVDFERGGGVMHPRQVSIP